MTGQTYEEQKKKTLDKYEEFISVAKGLPAELMRNINLNALRAKVENIRKNKFTLMVVGEAKSGKSTFINAYLKTDLLPMSVTQCTSAIIEISYSEKKLLTYYTAGGNSFSLSAENDIKDFLLNNAALNDEYKKIPIASIDQIIVNRKGHVPPSEINEMVETLKDDNIYNLPIKEFAKSIRQYINMRSKTWEKIVVRIVISYPFDPALKDISIIDSPGVNALGQVGEITEDYIEKANAVVFIKCLTGQALETKSFKSFLGTKNANRHKDSLFVLLSRASDHKPSDLDKLVSEARLMYGNNIQPNKIIPIDSLVQRYYNRMYGKTESEIYEILRSEAQAKIGFPWVSDTWQWKRSVDSFFSDMIAMAGFQEIDKNFELYARQAQRIALYELLTELNKAYARLNGNLVHEITLDEKKITLSPEQLAFEIQEIQDNLDILLNELHEVISELEEKYTGEGGVISKKKSEIIANVRKALDATNIDELETKITSITDPLKSFKESTALDVISECNQALRVKCQDKDFETWVSDVLVPDFPKEEVQSIKEKIAKKDDVYVKTTTGITFKETNKSLNRDKYTKAVIADIQKRLENIASDAQAELIVFIQTIFAKYHTKLGESIKQEKKRLSDKEEEKFTVEELQKALEIYKKIQEKINGAQGTLELLHKEVKDGISE